MDFRIRKRVGFAATDTVLVFGSFFNYKIFVITFSQRKRRTQER